MLSPSLPRRTLLGGAALLASPTLPGAEPAWPERPIRWIVNFPPAGAADILSRALGDWFGDRLGQPIVIENRPGAGGVLGPMQMASSAAPDGYTVAQIPITVFRLPFMRKTTFDPSKDLSYVISLTGYTFGVAVRGDAPWKTFPEFLEYAKKNPGKINYGTPGIGTSLHLTMERIATERDIDWTHVPFRGFAENMNALLGGQTDALADSSGWSQLVEDGKVRLLVTWGESRAKRFPEVPTLREVGIDIVSASPYGIAGPKGMAPEIVDILHRAFRKALEDEASQDIIRRWEMPEEYLGPAEYLAFARERVEYDKRMVARLKLSID